MRRNISCLGGLQYLRYNSFIEVNTFDLQQSRDIHLAHSWYLGYSLLLLKLKHPGLNHTFEAHVLVVASTVVSLTQG